MKYLAILSVLGAAGLVAWGGLSYRVESRPARPVEVDSPEQDLGECPVGRSEVVFRVTNPSDRPAEVVSVPESCGKMCCLKPVTPDRLPIPPGGSADVVCELVVIGPGPFEFNGHLYLNDNGLRTVNIAVRGTGVRPGAGNAPK